MSNISSVERPHIPPILGMVASLFAVSTAALFIRYAQSDNAPSLAIAAYRLTISALLLTPLVMMRHRAELRTLTRQALLLMLGAGAFLGLHFASWISSLEFTTVASSSVFVSTSPLVVGLVAPLVLNERLTRAMLLGILIATLGALVIGLADSCQVLAGRWQCTSFAELVRGPAFLGNTLAFVGAVALAGYLLIGRRLRASLSLTTYIWLVYGTAAVVLVLAAWVLRVPLLGYSASTLRWFVLLALVPQLIGHSLWNWALRYLSAAVVSVFTLGEPLAATLLAFVFLSEVPGTLMLVGGVLILGGILIATARPTGPQSQ